MLELDEALAQLLAALPPPQPERVPLSDACGRVALERIASPLDLPLFDNSAVDGYAVRAADVAIARAEMPVRLRLIGRAAAGEVFTGELTGGTSVRVFTGSPLPTGADAIVMQEDTQSEPQYPGHLLVLASARPWENVRLHGEDVKRGSVLVEAGERLTAGRIALLAAAGLPALIVGRRPVAGLLATGSELKAPGEPLARGQIYESNRFGLAPLIESAGGRPQGYPIVADTPETTRSALERAFGECDFVITCGGVSVGELDFVKAAFTDLGGEVQFWKVAIKPGRPFVFGRLGDKFLLGLPGNPVSAFVSFLLLARPALLRRQGASGTSLPAFPGVLAEPLANPGTRRHFMRVTVDAEGRVRSAGIQASHGMSSLGAANGLVDVPPASRFSAGTVVQVLRWE